MKRIGIFVFLFFLVSHVFAQLDEGKKMLDYERYQSAAKIFQSMLDKNSGNTEAAYWLGQTYVLNTDNLDTAAAKSFYQKMLQEHPNDPLLMVGVGEVELMEGKKDDAKNHFEAALGAVKKKKDLPPIQLAVGKANVDTKDGDANYAVEVLNEALNAKKVSNSLKEEIEMALGDAYRKLIDGGNAVSHYQQALALNPHAARASFMMGRIYETQGLDQEDIYMNHYFDAIREDPKFAPVYYWLYNYYYQRDVNQAREYLDEYVKVADQNSKLCYAQASLFYVSKMYDETIEKADACIAGTVDERPFPNLFGLKAYAYDKLGDDGNAEKYFKEFFERVNPDNIGPKDYLTYGKILMNNPETEAQGSELVSKAVDKDTLYYNKVTYVSEVAKDMFDKKNYEESAKWYTKLLALDTTQGKGSLYWSGYANYMASDYDRADSIFKVYQEKYPDDMTAWFLGARTNEAMDTTGEEGLALEDWKKVIELGDDYDDKSSVKQFLIPAYQYMIPYYYNIKSDVAKANEYNDKILEIDPDNAAAASNKEAFEAYLKRANAASNGDKKQ